MVIFHSYVKLPEGIPCETTPQNPISVWSFAKQMNGLNGLRLGWKTKRT